MTRLRMMVRLALVVSLVAYCKAAPAPVPDPAPINDNTPEIIEIIAPAQAAQETLESLNLGEPNSELSERNKRTIGILRQLFPSLSQIIDQKIQQIVSFLFRTVGRSLLSGALGGNRPAATSSTSGNKISVSLPTYGPDSDEDDDEDEDADSAPVSVNIASRVSEDADGAATETPADNEVQASTPADLSDSPSLAPSTLSGAEPDTSSSDSSESPSETEPSSSASAEPPTTESISSSSQTTSSESTAEISTITATSSETDSSTSPDGTSEADPPDSLPSATSATSAVNNDENLLSEAESQQSEVRVQFTEPEGETKAEAKDDDSDQDGAASNANGGAIDDLSLDDVDADSSDENRNKRFLNFGFGGGDSSSSGSGSGGGSGNFLFDIIRRPAESMARAAGQAFRILTGTDSIGLGITATHTAVRDVSNNTTKLVAGSGGTEQSDEATSAPLDGDVGKGDGYTEGIPGPVTRLFIIANRGISNLIQDLILRLAQTSERIVNFKARLITSII